MMQITLFSACLGAAVLLAACANLPAANPPEGAIMTQDHRPVVGGYAPADPADPSLSEAERMALDEIYRRRPLAGAVQSVFRESQIVAGMNYRFTVATTGGQTFRVTVYRALDGAMRVTGFETIARPG